MKSVLRNKNLEIFKNRGF